MKTINVNEDYQHGYTYVLSEPEGTNFHPDFQPQLTPAAMLKAGIFGGDYFRTVPKEFPQAWLDGVQLSSSGTAVAELNFFKVMASQPLKVWQQKGWIYFEDPKGWFLWYCRYYQGRRLGTEDERQIKRWRAMRRHSAQLKTHCEKGDWSCRPRQRQALLHWAYDAREL